MMKLAKPSYSFCDSISECIIGVTGNAGLNAKLTNNKSMFPPLGTDYIEMSDVGDLYLIPSVSFSSADPEVVGNIKKSELIKVYDQYFVPEKKPARKIYDALLNSAKGDCPFCGGIGTPRNLDHFLPKAHFPQFSVFPQNLVPSCRDCNMDGKADDYATCAADQLIQPYSDNSRFFDEQWVFAEYIDSCEGEPGEFNYFVRAPMGWSNTDIKRIEKHFDAFDIGLRYAKQAGRLLKTVLSQISRMRHRGVPDDEIIADILEPGIEESPFVNHWQTGMYQGLIDYMER